MPDRPNSRAGVLYADRARRYYTAKFQISRK